MIRQWIRKWLGVDEIDRRTASQTRAIDAIQEQVGSLDTQMDSLAARLPRLKGTCETCGRPLGRFVWHEDVDGVLKCYGRCKCGHGQVVTKARRKNG